MYKRIRMPYVEFIKRVELKDNSIMKKITENFLMIANEFSIYEILYHRHWSVDKLSRSISNFLKFSLGIIHYQT